MRASASVQTPEAEGLALRMRKHFAHEARVEFDGAVSRVRLPAGEFELEPAGDALAVRASSEAALLERALAELAGPGGEHAPGDGVIQDQASAERARGQANEGRTHGNAD